MKLNENHGKMLTVRNGQIICPHCLQNRLVQIKPDTKAVNLTLYCRRCKREITVNVNNGECFESRGR